MLGRILMVFMGVFRRIASFALAVVCVLGLSALALAEGAQEPVIPTTSSGMTHSDLLEKLCRSYLDQRFERYTSVPQYFQQDYPDVPFGGPGCTIANTGCGAATLAMLATYMTDQEYLTPTIAEMFASYATPSGVAFVMFDDSPEVLGFYLEGRAFYWSDVSQALENGQMVVCLQKTGLFTSTGHFILLTGLTEDGRVLVQDPDATNYEGEPQFYDGYENGFYVEDLTQNAGVYWLYRQKVVRTATCANCGNAETAGIAMEMFEADYFCPKCRIKIQKRELLEDMNSTDHLAVFLP